jgi:hypothetical protein
MAGFTFNNSTNTISVGDSTGGMKLDPGASDLVTVKNGVILPDGTKEEPALRFADDTNTGLYSPANEIVALAGNGTDVATFDGNTGQVSFGNGESAYSFPASKGTEGQTLKADTSGNLTWADASTGGGATGYVYNGTITTAPTATGEDAFAIGDGAVAGPAAGSIALGLNAKNNSTQTTNNTVLIGNNLNFSNSNASNSAAILVGRNITVPADNDSTYGASVIALNARGSVTFAPGSSSGHMNQIYISTSSVTRDMTGSFGSVVLDSGGTWVPSTKYYGYVLIGKTSTAPREYTVGIGNLFSVNGIDAVAIGNGASANASYATAIGSAANAGNSSGTCIGRNSSAGGSSSFAAGFSASASGSQAVAIGANTTASGQNAINIGSTTSVTRNYSVAIGNSALSNSEGSFAVGTYSFSYAGDTQRELHFMKALTSSNTATDMFARGTANARMTLPSTGAMWYFDAKVMALMPSDSSQYKIWEVKGVIARTGAVGTTTLVGSVDGAGTTAYKMGTGAEAWNLEVTADTSNGALKFTVTGDAGKTIRWNAIVETTVLGIG